MNECGIRVDQYTYVTIITHHCTIIFHFAEHEVGSTIHNTHDLCDIIPEKVRMKCMDYWNAYQILM